MFRLLLVVCTICVASVNGGAKKESQVRSYIEDLVASDELEKKLWEKLFEFESITSNPVVDDTLEKYDEDESMREDEELSIPEDIVFDDLIENLMNNPNLNKKQITDLISDLNVISNGPENEMAINEDKSKNIQTLSSSSYPDYVMDNDMDNQMQEEDRLPAHVLDKHAALAYLIKIKEEGRCSEPKAKLISIRSIHSYSDKTYIPHCVLLHQCGEDTGCCESSDKVCSPIKGESIQLPIYTMEHGKETNKEEWLTFFNHTKCACVQRIPPYEAFNSYLMKEAEYHSLPIEAETKAPHRIERCECPKEFSAHVLPDGSCECDCLDRHLDCLRLKRGKEHFGLNDRVCIRKGTCLEPKCEFGKYDRTFGKCPKKHEVMMSLHARNKLLHSRK